MLLVLSVLFLQVNMAQVRRASLSRFGVSGWDGDNLTCLRGITQKILKVFGPE